MGSVTEETADAGIGTLATAVLKLLIGFLALAVLIFAIGGFMYYVRDNFDSISISHFITYAISLLIFTILMIVLINAVIDAL